MFIRIILIVKNNMLILFLLYCLGLLFGTILSVLSFLPYTTEVNAVIAQGVGFAKGIITTIPYLQVVWEVFLAILVFEALLIIFKLFFGSRDFTHHVN